jgi:hypothetical protein
MAPVEGAGDAVLAISTEAKLVSVPAEEKARM